MDAIKKLNRNGLYFKYDDIRLLCKRYQISKLWVFGSSIRDDFKDKSDIDILVSYNPKNTVTLIDELYIQDELSKLFNRNIDLVEIETVKNPIRYKNIIATREIIYADT